MQFILLAYMVRCDHVDKEQFYKTRRARRHHEEDTIKALPRFPWIYLEVLCAPTLPASFKCALASNVCNWDSSLEICLQATGAASCICHIDLEMSCEWALGKDWWGRRIYDGNRKGQFLRFKPSNETTLAAGETHSLILEDHHTLLKPLLLCLFSM